MTPVNERRKHENDNHRKEETLVSTLIEYSIELKNEVEILKERLKASEEKLVEKESLFYDRLLQSQNDNAILLKKLNKISEVQQKLEKQNADLENRLLKIVQTFEEEQKGQLDVCNVSYCSSVEEGERETEHDSNVTKDCVPLLNNHSNSWIIQRLFEWGKKLKLKSFQINKPNKHSRHLHSQPFKFDSLTVIRL